jgi:hypothetical protein
MKTYASRPHHRFKGSVTMVVIVVILMTVLSANADTIVFTELNSTTLTVTLNGSPIGDVYTTVPDRWSWYWSDAPNPPSDLLCQWGRSMFSL